jgi:hypothetical protein
MQSSETTVSVFASDLLPALKTVSSAMRKIPAATRRNSAFEWVTITSTPTTLTISAFANEEMPSITINANVQSDFSAVITMYDASYLARYLDKRKAVLIGQTEKQTVFMQDSAARGYFDSMAYNPPPTLKSPYMYAPNSGQVAA